MSVFLQRSGLLSAAGGEVVNPPAYAAFSNVKFLSAMKANPAIDLRTSPNTITHQGGCTIDTGQTLFGQPMMEFDGTDDRIGKTDAMDGSFVPGTNEFGFFCYFHTPATHQDGTIATYIEKPGSQWRTYWHFSIGSDGKLAFAMWSGVTGGGYSNLATTDALDTSTTYLIGFSKEDWSSGQQNRRIFFGKLTDTQCVVKATMEHNGNTSGTQLSDAPHFCLGYYLVGSTKTSPLKGHIGEAVYVVGEPYITAAFDTPTVGWPRS